MCKQASDLCFSIEQELLLDKKLGLWLESNSISDLVEDIKEWLKIIYINVKDTKSKLDFEWTEAKDFNPIETAKFPEQKVIGD